MIKKVRLLHRYLGFFLSGVMAVYAISGVVLVFRNTNFLKTETAIETSIAPGLAGNELGDVLKIRKLKVTSETETLINFKDGVYNKQTGEAKYKLYELPYLLRKFEAMHKATTNSPLYIFNLFFGFSLLFFVISSFFMYMPKTKIFKRGIYVALSGLVLTIIMLYV